MLYHRIKCHSYLFLVLIPAVLFCCVAKAQDSIAVTRITDSGWIEKFNGQVVVKLAAINTAEALVAEGDNFKNVLLPNPDEIFRAYISYQFISFYVSYVPHFLPGNNDNAEKGSTKGIGLGTTLNFRNWFTEVYYSHTKGYYLDNTKDYQPDWQPGDPYAQVPGLVVNSFEGATGYNTNPHLSLQSTTTQTERQLKSAGSFIPRLNYRYYVIDNHTEGPYSTQRSRHIQALLGAGYQHTFVVKKALYFTGSFTPSFGYVFTKLLTRDGAARYTDYTQGPIYQWNGLLGMGYNHHRFFAGAYLTVTSATEAQGLTSAVIKSGQVFLQLFAGIRFAAPKFLRKNYDKIFH